MWRHASNNKYKGDHMKNKIVAIVTLITFTLSGCAGFQTRVANTDFNIGTYALNKGDYVAAEKKLKQAVYEGHLDRIAVGWNNLAVLYQKTGRQVEATDALTMAARYGEVMAAAQLSLLKLTIPSPDLVATAPPVPIGYKAGQTYFQDGLAAFEASNWVEAEKQFRLAIITGQELSASWNNLGAVYSRFTERLELSRFAHEMGAHYGSVTARANLVAIGRAVPNHDLMTREAKDAKAVQDKAYADARRAEEQRQAAADSKQLASNVGDVLLVLIGAAAIGAGAYYAAKKGVATTYSAPDNSPVLPQPATKALPRLTAVTLAGPAIARNICNCQGWTGPGGPCFAGVGGAAYDGPGGPAFRGPGGACNAGLGGPRYDGPGGAAYSGLGGPAYAGPGGPCYAEPGGPCFGPLSAQIATCPAIC